MSTGAEQQEPRHRSVLYIVVAVVLVILAVWAVIAFHSARETQQAEEKAAELVQVLDDAGARATPDPAVIARVLGDDGGAVCANPNEALSRATLFGMMTTGAGGPGERPKIIGNNILRGQLAIISVYCPDELQGFQQFVDSLPSAATTNG